MLEYTNLFLLNNYKKNDKILKYFKESLKKAKRLKTLKYHTLSKKLVLSIICNSVKVKMKRYLKKKNQLKIKNS